MNTVKWLEEKFCVRDGYVIMATFKEGSGRTRMWWPMNDDNTKRGRAVGSPCWSRKIAVERYQKEMSDPTNRHLTLALHKFSFDTCRGVMDPVPTEVVFKARPCHYQ